jgi:hypothetical protein
MTPLFEANAFRIWQFASKHEWNVTYAEIAGATMLDVAQVRDTIHRKRWGGRITKARSASGDQSKSIQYGHHKRGRAVDENNMDLIQLFRGAE